MTIITASIDASGPVSLLYRALLASLPNSYRVVDRAADVALVAGADLATVERADHRGSTCRRSRSAWWSVARGSDGCR